MDQCVVPAHRRFRVEVGTNEGSQGITPCADLYDYLVLGSWSGHRSPRRKDIFLTLIGSGVLVVGTRLILTSYKTEEESPNWVKWISTVRK